VIPERSVFRVGDLTSEALSGVLQRPARSVLTMLGTVLGVGAFVAVLGLTSTATGQIGARFDALKNTTVTVSDLGDGSARERGEPERVGFPDDGDERIQALNGAVAAGVWWTAPLRRPVIGTSVSVTAGSGADAGELPVLAASPGLFRVTVPTVRTGLVFNASHDRRRARVAVLGVAAARRLGISQLTAQPAVFVNGIAFTVVGIIDDVQRVPDLLLGIIVPRSTAEQLFGPPDSENHPAQMVIQTRRGAAQLIARQAPVALRPDNPTRMRAIPPPDPHSLRDNVNTDLAGLFLALAGVSLVIGAVGIANTTLAAVLERVGEIGLRRSLGARPRHIAIQFVTESTTLGLLGGLTGTTIGVGIVLLMAIAKDWTAVLEPTAVLPGPLIGAAIGMLAGAYPAVRAARIEPVEALRR
jgi:putative ABC transport system permease protein